MFIIQIHYKAALAEIDKYLQAHREFLEYYYMQGLLIASGPMTPREGGVIIASGNDREKIENIFKKDPYYLAGIAEYKFIEFTPVKHCDALKELILNTEGKLC
jgi:uncharacterized protein YciI